MLIPSVDASRSTMSCRNCHSYLATLYSFSCYLSLYELLVAPFFGSRTAANVSAVGSERLGPPGCGRSVAGLVSIWPVSH